MITIVSGGQTGADRAGLDAAIAFDLPHGGWCPLGRKAEDGPIANHYKLKEMASSQYIVRTKQNVIDSDATVIFTFGALETSLGSLRTGEFADEFSRPWCHINLNDQHSIEAGISFVNNLLILSTTIINIAGSRESTAPGIYKRVKVFLETSFSMMS